MPLCVWQLLQIDMYAPGKVPPQVSTGGTVVTGPPVVVGSPLVPVPVPVVPAPVAPGPVPVDVAPVVEEVPPAVAPVVPPPVALFGAGLPFPISPEQAAMVAARSGRSNAGAM